MMWIIRILIGMLVIKTLTGFHFSWEKCECCGKKFRDHVKFNGRLYKKCGDQEW